MDRRANGSWGSLAMRAAAAVSPTRGVDRWLIAEPLGGRCRRSPTRSVGEITSPLAGIFGWRAVGFGGAVRVGVAWTTRVETQAY